MVYAVVGCDVGFENPLFASIELSYEEVDKDPEAEPPQKMLTLYELLGARSATYHEVHTMQTLTYGQHAHI